MKLSDLLPPDGVKVLSGCTSKKRLFQDLSEFAGTVLDLDSETVRRALSDRESLGPTGFGQGIALPHGRIEGLSQMAAVFLRLERPMDFQSVDRQPVDLVFGLFAPVEAGADHLKALALVSRTLRDPAICEKLRANDDPATLYMILTEHQSVQVA